MHIIHPINSVRCKCLNNKGLMWPSLSVNPFKIFVFLYMPLNSLYVFKMLLAVSVRLPPSLACCRYISGILLGADVIIFYIFLLYQS